MCSYCLQSPCPPGCPNYYPPSNGICDSCGEPLPIGSKVVELSGRKYHYSCVCDMPYSEVLEIAGINNTDDLIDLLGGTVDENPSPDYE